MTGYKLLRVRKDGSIGPLFINKKLVIPIGKWMTAEPHLTKGFKFRPFFHCCSEPVAPHLSEKGRRWYRVEMKGVEVMNRPAHQGGTWYLAKQMRIIEQYEN